MLRRALGVLALIALGSAVAAQTPSYTPSTNVEPFLTAQGGVSGCLLHRKSGPNAAFLRRADGTPFLLTLVPDPAGSCAVGALRFACKTAMVQPGAADDLDAVCAGCGSGPGDPPGYCKNDSWIPGMEVARAVAVVGGANFTGGTIDREGALLLRDGSDPTTPALLIKASTSVAPMSSPGTVVPLEGTTAAIRETTPATLLTHAAASGQPLASLRWIGPATGTPPVAHTVTADGTLRRGGSVLGRLVNAGTLAARLAAFDAAVTIEDATPDPAARRRALMLALLDPEYDRAALIAAGFALAPQIYLLD